MPKRILAADDSRTIRTALMYTFAKEPEMDLVIVDNGQAVLEAIQRESFDLLLLDYNMPGMTGIELCLRISQNPQTNHIPVLLLIGQKFNASLAAQAGAIGQVRKPFATAEMIECVAEVLQVSFQPAPQARSNKMGILDAGDIAIEIDVDGSGAPNHLKPPPLPTQAAATPLTGPTKAAATPLTGPPSHLASPSPHFMPPSSSPKAPSVPPLSPTHPQHPNQQMSSPLAPPTFPTPSPAIELQERKTPPQPAMSPTLSTHSSEQEQDMLIDDLPYDAGAKPNIHTRETPPQPSSGMFMPTPQTPRSASMTGPGTDNRPQTSGQVWLSPDSAPENRPPPKPKFEPRRAPPVGAIEQPIQKPGTQGFHNIPPADSPFAAPNKAPYAPPPFTGPRSPTPQPQAGKPTPSARDTGELLLPLEDDSKEFPMSQVSGDGDAIIFDPTSAEAPMPRVDHLKETATVPKVRHPDNTDDAPPISIPFHSQLESPEDENTIPLSADDSVPPEFDDEEILTPEEPASPQLSCPNEHCQLILAGSLSLQSVAALLQFADVVKSKLGKFLKVKEEPLVTVSVASLPKKTILTLGGAPSYLRGMLPSLVECCGLPEDSQQEVIETLIAEVPEAEQQNLRKALRKSRITNHPYSLALRHQISELANVPLHQLVSSLQGDQVVLYESVSDNDLESVLEAESRSVELTLPLWDMLVDHLSLMELHKLMEEEFLPLEEIVPLNLTQEAIFLAVVSYFEQRHQLPELAEAIQELHPSFDTAPFESFSGY